MTKPLDPEIKAMRAVVRAITAKYITDETRRRMIRYFYDAIITRPSNIT